MRAKPIGVRGVSSVSRPTWDQFGLGLAKAVSVRGDCSRRQVGAVILDEEHRISGGGYNGTYPGNIGCLDGGCPRAASNVEPGSSYDTGPGLCIASHAESNAVMYTDRDRRHTIYITDAPCLGCEKLLRNSGLVRAVWPNGELIIR